MRRTWMVVPGTLVGLLLMAASAAAASDPVAKCAASKIKATGKKASSKLKCWSKAVGKATTVDPLCVGKAETKFSDAFAKAESKGGCGSVNDVAGIETLVDVFVGDVVAALPGGTAKDGQKCAASKLTGTGKKADAKLKCHSKAITKAVAVDPECLTKAEDKFVQAFGKAEAKGGCTTTGDAPTLEERVDQFVAAVLVGVPSTTTTTSPIATTTSTSTSSTSTTSTSHPTTTSTSTTTTTIVGVPTTTTSTTSTTSTTIAGQVCGNGIQEGAEECDIVPAIPQICTSSCTWVPAVCGDGFRQNGETCDDGNTLNGDACPSNCVINTCAPTQTTVQGTVSYSKTTSVSVGSIVTLLDYPDGTVSIPGIGSGAGGAVIVVPTGFSKTVNDLDYAVQVLISSSTGAVLAPGQIYRVAFKLCLNHTAPPVSAFSCQVLQAATSGSPSNDINLATNPMSCSVTIP